MYRPCLRAGPAHLRRDINHSLLLVFPSFVCVNLCAFRRTNPLTQVVLTMTIKLDWMRGCATALVTPFRRDGSVDDECFVKLVERQIKGGVRLLVPCGTTGESVPM